jgi:transposase
VDLINSLYRKEHEIKEDWEPDKILRHRQEYAPPILEKLKKKLLRIQADPGVLPQSPLGVAVNYTLGEYNYILRHDYKPDNAIECLQRYISLSRKNAGAERTALIYSLACSCRLNRIKHLRILYRCVKPTGLYQHQCLR